MSKEILEAISGLTSEFGTFEARMADAIAASEQRVAQVEVKIAEVAAKNAEAATALAAVRDEIQERTIEIGLSDKDVKRYSISRAISGFLVRKDPAKFCPFEFDIHQQIMKARTEAVEHRFHGLGAEEFVRTMTSLADSEGAFLIPEEKGSQLYENFRAQSIRSRLGVTNLRPTGIPYRTNKITGNTTAYRRGEGNAVSASDMAFGQVTMSPKSVSARTVLSQENVMWTDPATDVMAERDLMESINLKQDYDFFMGTGGSNTPIGIINTTGVSNNNAGSGSGTAPTYEVVGIDLPYLLENANALVDDGSLGYAGVPGHVKMLRKEVSQYQTSGGTPYIIPPWGKPTGSNFLPWTLYTTTQLQGLGADSGASPLFFGRWSDALHAMWGGFMVKRSDIATDGTNNALTEGWVHIVITGWDDVGVVRPASIVYDDTMDHA